MNLKIVLVAESLVFGIFLGVTLFLTRFVKFFEVKWELSILISYAFLPAFVLGPVFVFVRLRTDPDKEAVKRLIVLLVIVLIGMIVVLSIQSIYDYGSTYRRELAKVYNQTQGAPNDYLDRLHEQFACCGVSSMELNVANDTNVFQPDLGMYTRFPKSCCPVVEEHQNCSSENIYITPCDVFHYERAKIFNYVTVPLLVISLAWKIAMIFIYQNHQNSLFD